MINSKISELLLSLNDLLAQRPCTIFTSPIDLVAQCVDMAVPDLLDSAELIKLLDMERETPLWQSLNNLSYR